MTNRLFGVRRQVADDLAPFRRVGLLRAERDQIDRRRVLLRATALLEAETLRHPLACVALAAETLPADYPEAEVGAALRIPLLVRASQIGLEGGSLLQPFPRLGRVFSRAGGYATLTATIGATYGGRPEPFPVAQMAAAAGVSRPKSRCS